MNFSFHPVIKQWFESRFTNPSPPQEKGWPSIADKNNTLILAPTGSGKTLAAFLWCIDDLFRHGLNSDDKNFQMNLSGVHTLYISPLKALNNDIHQNLQEPLRGIRQEARKQKNNSPDIRVMVRTGDTPSHVRQSMVKKPPHILITTPESLFLLLTSVKGREIFRNLRYLIIDEIHAVCNNKRGVHLSLSLERLMSLCTKEPVRIGLSATQRPLQRIADYLGGQHYDFPTHSYKSRPVTIVDCGQRKDMDLKVLAPINDFSELPEAIVWPAVYNKLYELIRSHKSTLVFVNMRAQTEKIARQINDLHQQETGDPESEIAFAHHGSLSRERRYDIETQFKAGELPAVVATASLELGIDIGSIELVVQLESPKSITSALQRVGRSGHVLHATSKGRIIPLYPGDLDDSIAIARAMIQGDIEETVIPENCLDVLAQQIVAEVSMQQWNRADFYHIVKSSYCYRNLSENVFDRVLEMLSGRFADAPLPSLKPRLTWDRINDRLVERTGSRFLSVMNGGTIPDRGYYGVYLADSNVKLGEMEEEFVFESRVGEVFYLGSQEWLIHEITHDRIIVSSAHSVKPKAPFWKGDILYRDLSTQLKVGFLRREWLKKNISGQSEDWFVEKNLVDPEILDNVNRYFKRQKVHTDGIAHDRKIIAEFFRDVSGEPQLILHAPFGARVNGAWVVALAAALEKFYKVQVQYDYNDDGIIFRILDTNNFPPFEELFRLSKSEIEKLLIDTLADTPLFSINFRYNATRALLLQRSFGGKRIPLWLQRLRSADLLQIVRKYPDFPIVIETYRECLQDIFDLPALRNIIDRLHNNEIELKFVQTPSPSPMASGLIFKFTSNNLYELDRSRYTGQIAEISTDLLAEVLEKEHIPGLVTRNIVEESESRWQYKADEFRARNREELFTVIERLGPIEDAELVKRSKTDPRTWMQELVQDKRITHLNASKSGWISASDKDVYTVLKTNINKETFQSGSSRAEQIQKLLLHFLQTRGPISQRQLENELNLPGSFLAPILTDLKKDKQLVYGALLQGQPEGLWCHRPNFAELYRRAVAERRRATTPAPMNFYFRFMLHWHCPGQKKSFVMDFIRNYRGIKFAPYFFERELWNQHESQHPGQVTTLLGEFYQLIQDGDVIVRAFRESPMDKPMLEFFLRGEGQQFYSITGLEEKVGHLDDQSRIVYAFLQENGASFNKDISAATGLPREDIENTLHVLACDGLVSCDSYEAYLLTLERGEFEARAEKFQSSIYKEVSIQPGFRKSHGRRRVVHRKVQERLKKQEGRWFTTRSFGAYGKTWGEPKLISNRNKVTMQSRVIAQARILLQRYGILVKEWYRHEKGMVPWYPIFQALKRLEWQGEIRRGYFITGLSGVQFALPEAVDLLARLRADGEPVFNTPRIYSTASPALPLGGSIKWPLKDRGGRDISIVRSLTHHLFFVKEQPVIYCENYGNRVHTLVGFQDNDILSLALFFKKWLFLPTLIRPRRRIEIIKIDQELASYSPLAPALLDAGFERDLEKLVLWPMS